MLATEHVSRQANIRKPHTRHRKLIVIGYSRHCCIFFLSFPFSQSFTRPWLGTCLEYCTALQPHVPPLLVQTHSRHSRTKCCISGFSLVACRIRFRANTASPPPRIGVSPCPVPAKKKILDRSSHTLCVCVCVCFWCNFVLLVGGSRF